MKCRLSPTDRNSVEDTDSRFEKGKKIIYFDSLLLELSYLLRKYHLRVMTKPTSHIASRRKYHSRYMARVIEEGTFLESGEEHAINEGMIFDATAYYEIKRLKYHR